MTCLLCPKYDQKARRGGLPEKLGGGVQHPSWNPSQENDVPIDAESETENNNV